MFHTSFLYLFHENPTVQFKKINEATIEGTKCLLTKFTKTLSASPQNNLFLSCLQDSMKESDK